MDQQLKERENLDNYYCINTKLKFPKERVYAIAMQYMLDNNLKNANDTEIFNHIQRELNLERLNISKLKDMMNDSRVIDYGFLLSQYRKYKFGISNNDQQTVQNKQSESEIKYYFCTKKIKFPLKDVVKDIYNLFKKYSTSQLDLNTIYEYMADKYEVSSFNRANLSELLQPQKNIVYFNYVKDLYINSQEEELKNTCNFKLLYYLFIQQGYSLRDFLVNHGLSEFKNQINQGYISIIGQQISDNDKTILLELLNSFSESEWLNILEDSEQFNDYLNLFIEDQKEKQEKLSLRDTLNNYFEFVHSDNLDATAKYLFPTNLSETLSQNNIIKIRDLKKLSLDACIALYPFKKIIINILKRLQYSLTQYINEKFRAILQLSVEKGKENKFWQKNVAILEYRMLGETLESAGSHFELTRERTRQLEKKYLMYFNSFYNNENGNLNNVFRAFVCDPLFITKKDIEQIVPTHPKLFKYFLQNIEVENLLYIEEIDKFYFIDDYDWYRELLIISENLPAQLHKDQVPETINNALELMIKNGINISYSECETILLQEYKTIGSIYTKTSINISDRIKHILKTYYNKPVNIYDNNFLNDIRKHYEAIYHDDKLKTNHAITSLISRVSILADRGSYILNDRMFMSKELASNIYNYIMKSPKETFLTNTLFTIFKEELVAQGITNKYFLQGSLKQHYNNDLFFRRDYISKTKNASNILEDIEKYLKERRCVVHFDEFKAEFIGAPDHTILMALSQDGILGYRKKYIHADTLSLTDDEISLLKNITKQFVNDGEIHHVKDLFAYLQFTNSSIISRLYLDDHFGLYSVLEYYFQNDFEFKRPFMALPGVTIENQYDRILEYISDFDEITIDDILEFTTNNKLHIYSITEFIDSLDNYVFKDENSIISLEKTNINKYNTEIVEQIILKEFGGHEFIFADKLNGIHLFPKEVEWTPWTIYSAINKYGKTLKAIPSDTKYKFKNFIYARPLIINRNVSANNINEYKEFLRNRKSDLNDTQFYMYLRSKGLAD